MKVNVITIELMMSSNMLIIDVNKDILQSLYYFDNMNNSFDFIKNGYCDSNFINCV